jgi:hypothetical protein
MNRVLQRIFGPKRDDVTGGVEKITYREEFYALYSLPNVIRLVKSRRLRWAGNVARMGTG